MVQLNIASTIIGQTIAPNVDMTVAYYNITGYGPEGVNFTRNNVTSKNVLLDNLAPGFWTIEVKAYNSSDIHIASGLTNVEVLEEDTVNATVTVRPLAGTGSLRITMNWSNTPLPNPVVAATLTPKDGSAVPISFNILGNTAEFVGDFDSGYYTLVLLLNDGTTFKWGAAEAVRILTGQLTEGHFGIDGTGLGDINLTIIDDLQNPVSVDFTGQSDYLITGTDMTITATTSEPVDSYQWFIDGHPIAGATSATITFGSTLPRGPHRLDLIVTKNVSAKSIVSSGTVKFRVSSTIPSPTPGGGFPQSVYDAHVNNWLNSGWIVPPESELIAFFQRAAANHRFVYSVGINGNGRVAYIASDTELTFDSASCYTIDGSLPDFDIIEQNYWDPHYRANLLSSFGISAPFTTGVRL